MNLKVGIVGLPNVGKSTLFNILTKSSIPAENYPFTTIDPNVGIVEVPDERLDRLFEIEKPERKVPAVVEFVDIAGLVRGAHKGEGLGNKFLANIREVSIILHVVRGFEDSNIAHVDERTDPISDIETIELELILKDLETINSVLEKNERFAKADKDIAKWVETCKELKKHLEDEKKALNFNWPEELDDKRKEVSLLTDKLVIYLLNSDKEINDEVKEEMKGKNYFVVNLKQEEELVGLSNEEREAFIKELDIKTVTLNDVIKETYKQLRLIVFFTVGPKEVRAWTINKGSSAPEAAGAIHSDFQDKFIAADVVSYQDFVNYGGWDAKEEGKVRLEGKEYIVQDGDVLVFRQGS